MEFHGVSVDPREGLKENDYDRDLIGDALHPLELADDKFSGESSHVDNETNEDIGLESDELDTEILDNIQNNKRFIDDRSLEHIIDNYDFARNVVIDPNALKEFLYGDGTTLEELYPEKPEEPETPEVSVSSESNQADNEASETKGLESDDLANNSALEEFLHGDGATLEELYPENPENSNND